MEFPMVLILLTVGKERVLPFFGKIDNNKERSHDITRPVVVYFSSSHSNTTHAAGITFTYPTRYSYRTAVNQMEE